MLEGLLKAGCMVGFGNLGQQAIIRFLNVLGGIRGVTIHVKLPQDGEGIYEMEMHGNEVSTFLRRLAGDLGIPVNFGSIGVGGWNLEILDRFEKSLQGMWLLQRLTWLAHSPGVQVAEGLCGHVLLP